jgi:hypothetical protein
MLLPRCVLSAALHDWADLLFLVSHAHALLLHLFAAGVLAS